MDVCAPLSEQGLSLREMEERTGIAKTSIQEALRDVPRKVKRKCGYAPYGYVYFDGKLVIDPKEQLVIRKIIKLRELGKNYQEIANELNTLKTPTRLGKKWGKSVVRSLALKEELIES